MSKPMLSLTFESRSQEGGCEDPRRHLKCLLSSWQEGYEIIMLVLGREVWSTSGCGRVWQKGEVSGRAH